MLNGNMTLGKWVWRLIQGSRLLRRSVGFSYIGAVRTDCPASDSCPKSARIQGDVHYDSLTIEQGAQVDGRFAPRAVGVYIEVVAFPEG